VGFDVGFCGGVELTSHLPLTLELRIPGALPPISLGVVLNTGANLRLPSIIIIIIIITSFQTAGGTEWSSVL
jgi:hypothetical protein